MKRNGRDVEKLLICRETGDYKRGVEQLYAWHAKAKAVRNLRSEAARKREASETIAWAKANAGRIREMLAGMRRTEK